MHLPKNAVPCTDPASVLRDGLDPSVQHARYGLYFTPAPESAWATAGWAWLGRDAHSGMARAQPQVAGVDSARMAALTASPRRYGFHATLKAPFFLAEGRTEAHLVAMVARFCERQPPVPVHGLGVRLLGGFLALCASAPDPDVGALAQQCVVFFDALRAPATADYLARRRRAGLSARQEALLMRWGYPYTEEAFRFHMTLSGNLETVDAVTVAALHHAAQTHFADVLAVAPQWIDGVTIFKEAKPGAPFLILDRYGFSGTAQAGATKHG